MDVVTKLFFRIIGPILLISALTVFQLQFTSLNRFVTNTKKTTTENSVYEESTLAASKEDVISKDELMAILMAGPDCNMVVYDTTSGVTLTIHAGMSVNSYVKVKYRNAGNESKDRTIYFGKDRWNAEFLDLSDWIMNSEFVVTEITYSTGSLRKIFYNGRS